MSCPLVLDIFGMYFSEELNIALTDSRVTSCNLDVENRTMQAEIMSECYINRDNQISVIDTLKSVLKLEICEIKFSFSPSALCTAALADITTELRLKNAALNGYFAGAEYNFSDETVNITLKHGGYKRICELNFERDFVLSVKNRFDTAVSVTFDGQLEDMEIELPPAEPQVVRTEKKPESKPQAPKTEIKFDKREEKPANGMVYLDNPKLFYGRKIETATKPMIEVTGDDTEICCWGEVFETEVRTINTKRGEANIFTFSFSDHTNSLTASMFMDPKKMGDVAPVKKGNFILVNGSYEFDNYKKEFIVKPRSMPFCRNTPKRMIMRAKSE